MDNTNENVSKPLFSMSIDEIVDDLNKKDDIIDEKTEVKGSRTCDNLKIVALTSSVVFILFLSSPFLKSLCSKFGNEYMNNTCTIPIFLTLIFGMIVFILLNQLPAPLFF